MKNVQEAFRQLLQKGLSLLHKRIFVVLKMKILQ